MIKIDSPQNDRIKRLIKYNSKNGERKKAQVIVVEGVQENQIAQDNHYKAIEFYICPEIYSGEIPQNSFAVSPAIYQKIAYRGTTEGIIGVYRTKNEALANYHPSKKAAIVVLEGTEKPGNLGSILRSTEALGIEAVILTDAKLDLYNPNVIRSSVGCLFGMKIYQSNNQELWAWLQEHKVPLYTTYMHDDSRALYELDLTRKSALLFGTEHSGISDFWAEKGQNFLVPMTGKIDSLNLSNAVAISCYEVLKQKSSQS
jgi:RNA methyltransferase, TrmH family